MGRKKKPDEEKVKKPGVSLDAECRLILEHIKEMESQVHLNNLSHSALVQKCVRIAWAKHYLAMWNDYTKGEEPPAGNDLIVKPSNPSGIGFSIQKTANSLRAG